MSRSAEGMRSFDVAVLVGVFEMREASMAPTSIGDELTIINYTVATRCRSVSSDSSS